MTKRLIISISATACAYFLSQIAWLLEIFSKIPEFKLRKMCPYSELLFWSVFSRIRTEYGEMRSISPYLVRMRESTDQNNSECGHFSCSVKVSFNVIPTTRSSFTCRNFSRERQIQDYCLA